MRPPIPPLTDPRDHSSDDGALSKPPSRATALGGDISGSTSLPVSSLRQVGADREAAPPPPMHLDDRCEGAEHSKARRRGAGSAAGEDGLPGAVLDKAGHANRLVIGGEQSGEQGGLKA